MLKTGGVYTSEHVKNLKVACSRWLPAHSFVCLTDDPSVIDGEPLKCGLRGWWSKIELFRPDLVVKEPTLFFDLDTVLRGDITEALKSVAGEPFVILRDVYRKGNSMQSSVMYWEGDHSYIFEAFRATTDTMQMRGDQDYLEKVLAEKTVAFWQDKTSDLESFKVGSSSGKKIVAPIVFFHGNPRPWQQTKVPYPGAHAEIVVRNGWAVPTTDTKALQAILREVRGIDSALAYCTSKRTAIQAGGNIGIWPKTLSSSFDAVITAEPDRTNFHALCVNTGDCKNIEKHNAGFSDKEQQVSMTLFADNIGAHFINPNSEGDTELITIDSLGVKDCDLLQLDIEGSEHQALLGAEKTIKASHPVIMLELKGLGRKFGYTDQNTVDLLKSWGYSLVKTWCKDFIFTYGSAADT